MCPEVADPGKAFAAAGTSKRFLPCVNPLVLLQVSRLRKELPASLTLEGLLSRVDPLMSFHIGQSSESLPTVLTDVALALALLHALGKL